MNLFKKKPQGDAPRDQRRSEKPIADGRRAGEGSNPYLSARRTWNDHVGRIVALNKMLLLWGLAALMIVLVAVGGVIHIGSQSKFVPFLYEVDKLGQTRGVGPISTTSKTDPRVVSSMLSDWLNDARMVTVDVALQRRAVLRVYAKLSPKDPATIKMNEWLNGNPEKNPFKRAETELASVEIKSILQQTPETWQVDWVETTRDRTGALKTEPATWRALVTVYQAETNEGTTDEQLRANPANLFVRDFSWSRVQ
ncbi:MAG: conjugal transfer protein TrbF [Thiobacillus sp.]|nr:conjugal transfer protein TrbF [Thiobacillus sp.]